MKGRMDVLNLKKRCGAKNSSNMLQSGSVRDVIKIEPNDELDKENCKNSDYVTDLTLNDSRDDEPMSNDEGSESMRDEVFATEIVEDDDDDEEVENPGLPMFSVMVKEENSNDSGDSSRDDDPVRSRVEIKYEDDIEEEEYDSDDESVEHSEMNHVNGMSDDATPLNYSKVNGKLSSNISPAGIPYRTCFNTDYFDPTMVNFQMGGQMGSNDSMEDDVTGDMDGDSEDRNDKSDSILLSIVYATINVPFSQVSKFLTAYNLSKAQLSVIRKVRRQVKNRLYAQNCRKRRVAHIKNLATELQQIKVEKEKLCSIQSALKVKLAVMEDRYNQFYAYVMNALAERHRNEEFDFSDIDSNMNDSSEETKLLKRKLEDDYEELDFKKQKFEQKYDELYDHVFGVIKSRHHNNGLTRSGMDSNIDFQLCHMDIVNELAMLNKYWTKNNTQKSNEQMDFESSVSVDGSRTSENKLNDFVDFESSVSVDGSRCGESKMNDFVDYESSVDYTMQKNNNAHYQNSGKAPNPNEIVTIDDDDDNDDADADDECDNRENKPDLDRSSQSNHTEKNSRIDDSSLIEWSEEEVEDADGGDKSKEVVEDDDDDEDDDLDQDIREYMAELSKQKKALESDKNLVQERYQKLYEHVLKALEISETEFLKSLLDYCIGLMKSLTMQQPSIPKLEPRSSSVDLNGS
ncbi:protein PFC0760c-like [Planococcus citri]|uniref:protein PFC0760c-like n=1 Tax=Planococcus citri TaxID=170843 RepID=UPI0031F88F01